MFPQDVVFTLYITATFFKILSPNIREFLISERVQVPPRTITKIDHQGNHKLLLIRNAAVEAENKTRTIKVAVQPEKGNFHTRKFMVLFGGNPSIQMGDLGSSFKSEE